MCTKSFRATLLAMAAAVGATSPALAADAISVPRADGAVTPLMVYRPAASAGCTPLAVISHGAGGSENGYGYLAQGMADLGYTAIVMGHRESGLAALRADMRARGLRNGVAALVGDPAAESARLLDVDAALAWADAQCRVPFKVLLGHSMGSSTVLLEARAHDMIGIGQPPAGRDRFDAYVALSPDGPGLVFPEHAWRDIHKPVLMFTGTRDQSLTGPPATRQVPWAELPGTATHCQWLDVIDGATHMNFGGAGPGSASVDDRVLETTAAFLNGVRHSTCALPPAAAGTTLTAK